MPYRASLFQCDSGCYEPQRVMPVMNLGWRVDGNMTVLSYNLLVRVRRTARRFAFVVQHELS